MQRRRQGKAPGQELLDVVRDVRRRWRTRQALQGGAIVLAAGFAVFFASTFGIDRLRFDPTAVTTFRLVLWGCVAALVGWFVARPLLRRVSDEQVALYLEEHEPSLKSAFLSAVDRARKPGAAAGLDRRLLEVAVERARRVERGRRVERERLRRSSAWLAGVGTAVAVILLFGPAFQGTAGSLLVGPWKTADAANPYAIAVEPGDALIARGSDQRVTARPRGFQTDDVVIAVRRGDAETWDRYSMTPNEDGSAFDILLFDLDEPADYAVESEGVRSPVFRIDVADLPYVDRIDLEYRFPAYTGLEPRTVEDGGDIAALRGTEVGLRITPTLATPGARLVFDGAEAPVPLEALDGGFEGSILVQGETFYRVELQGPDGRWVDASPEYLVEPLDDQPPAVTITEPGRDSRASPIEELYVEVEAEDDFGVGSVELVYSVNGGEETAVSIHRTRAGGTRDVSGGHTLFLEEFGLEPGDVISYYARATDLSPGAGAGAGTETSDIYFVTIRPFDRDFRQAEQGGGGGGGGGGMNGELSEQQRQIVAATFRLDRDGEDFAPSELDENLATLTLLQGRLRERVETLVDQMRQRGVADVPEFRTVIEELPKAAEAMREAETALGERDLAGALPPEQRALRHAQRAEAAFRDVQVQMGEQAGGGGSGGGASSEELADLFELEMDKLRNQYESVQRGEREQTDAEVDEALQKLEELARRQQQMNERAAARPRGAGGGGEGQQQLIDETEELARQLDRLSRQDGRPELEESARRLREAANRMRQSQANGRQGQGQADASSALDRLRDARRLLENRQTSAMERDVADALRRAERLEERQRDLSEDVGRAAADEDLDRIGKIRERKDELAREVDALEQDLDRMARESRREQPETSRSLGGAAETIRERRIRDKLLYSKGVLGAQSEEYVRNFEDQITADVERVREQLEEARDSFRESDPRRLGRQLEETRDLVRGLESLRDRIERRSEGEAGERQDASEGRQGQRGEGQRGEGRQGEGQQGREGQGQQGQGQQGQGEGQQGRGGQGVAGPPSGGSPSGAGFGPAAGGGGGLTPDDIRQFQREFRQRREDAVGLRDELRGESVDVDELSDVVSALERLSNARSFDDPEELLRLQDAVLRGLKDFEFSLRRGLSAELERLFLSGSDDVPPEYRRLVEEYYRSLSEGGPPE